MPLREGLPVWPGDEPFRYTLGSRIASGSTVNLGCVSLSLHAGTHVDAPFHSRDGAETVNEMDLSPFLGPAVLIDVAGRSEIDVEDIMREGPTLAPRVLLRTGAWSDKSTFPLSVPVISPRVPAFLHRHGVVLLGVDLPSVDPIESKDLPNHRRLQDYGIQILESLVLEGVPAGQYELIALPLRLEGADGSPVRAILRTRQE